MSFQKDSLPKDAINSNEIDSIYTFLSHVDWSEPFLQGIVTFHVICLVLILCTRRKVWFQGAFFTILLISISLTEYANKWLAENFKMFLKLQYFDSHGMFISLLYSSPVLVNCVLILINWFYISGDMLVKVKRKQIEDESKKIK